MIFTDKLNFIYELVNVFHNGLRYITRLIGLQGEPATFTQSSGISAS